MHSSHRPQRIRRRRCGRRRCGQILAGGQTLLPSMKQRRSQPGHLVDLGGVKELVV
jgi:CO/xanthine dehydrogenase FAD-binding subunit